MALKDFIEEMLRQVGPRPAGSESEFRAGEIIAGEFRNRGAEVSFHDAVTRPDYIRNLINLMTFTYGVSLALYFIVPAAAAALIAVMLLSLFLSRAVGTRVIHWMFRKAPTRNVIGVYRPTGETRHTLVFSGHYDSPNNMPLFYSPLKRYAGWIENAATLGAVMLMPAGILRALWGGPISCYDALYGISLLGFMVTLFFRSTMITNVRNLGANDNLSAIAVMVGLAERLEHERPRHTEVHLVSFGAEEPDLAGSLAYARDNAGLLQGAASVNLETLGAGTLAVITKEKSSGIRYTPGVVDLIVRAAAGEGIEAPAVAIGYGGTDSGSLVKHGGRSACLFGMDETGLFSLWHSPEDRPENISEENLQRALKICLRVIALTEEGRGVDSGGAG
ncbi:MAG: M28 family peptidase [Spirochaetes bacterium]|nr:M28 family peptidase [Spirochaetota bacterium]